MVQKRATKAFRIYKALITVARLNLNSIKKSANIEATINLPAFGLIYTRSNLNKNEKDCLLVCE